jgi:nucleoside-diphosphate-sugar epimerase
MTSEEKQTWPGGRKILVLGGSGFIGQHLVRALVQKGADPTVVVHQSPWPTSVPPSVARDDLARVRVERGDVCDAGFLAPLVDDAEVIYALAGKSGAALSNREPLRDLDVNCRGLLNLLEACRVNRSRARIVFPSSRLVYDKCGGEPVSESHPLYPRSIYGVHKLTGEHYLSLYRELYGLQTVILRVTNPYGFESQPAAFTHGIVNHFFRQTLRGESIRVFGDGSQLRDYLYIDDAVDALLLAGEAPAAVGQIFNLGSGEGVKLSTVAETIVDLVGRGGVNYVPWPSEDLLVETGSFVADISKMKSMLGWTPAIGLKEGLARMNQQMRATPNPLP